MHILLVKFLHILIFFLNSKGESFPTRFLFQMRAPANLSYQEVTREEVAMPIVQAIYIMIMT